MLLIFSYGQSIEAREAAVYTEKTPQVEYDWGLGGPNGLNDNFEAHFDQSQELEKGDYFIQTMADDGVRVDVNGNTVIDRLSYSYSSLVDRAVLNNTQKGLYDIQTSYQEGIKGSFVYSHVVPFNDWLAYYYPNTTTSGTPKDAEIISEDASGALAVDVGTSSPAPNKIPADGYSAKFVTAKKLEAGDYILRVGADNGVQVYVDGELVVDRFEDDPIKEEAVKVKISDQSQGDQTHWIEVRYKHSSGSSNLNFLLQPYNEVMDISPGDGWVGEVSSDSTSKSQSIILGGKQAFSPLMDLDLNWGSGSPHPEVSNDHFSATFNRKWEIDSTDLYSIQVSADDKVRVYVDGDLIIDSWEYVSGGYREAQIPLTKGIHDIKVDYYESILNARIKFDIVKESIDYNENNPSIKHNWGASGPIRNQYDYFTAKFDQSQHLDQGDYFVQTYADDGVFVDVDGKEVINRWKYSPEYIDRSVLTDVSAGNHNITTLYNEGVKGAGIFSDIVPFGNWLAYYYENEEFEGTPLTSKVIDGIGQFNDLNETNWQDSPVPGVVPEDHFSALYSTAMKLPEGDYVLRTGADDGLQVYIDGELVLDRFSPAGYREDDVKVHIENNDTAANPDVHWIEVKYKEGILSSRLNVGLQPYNEIEDPSVGDGWVGEVFPNIDLTGTPVVLGGKSATTKIDDLNFDWGLDSPSPLIEEDYFSTRFKKKVNITEPGYYVLNAWADDGVKVYVDGQRLINSWSYQSNHLRQAGVNLTSGEHTIVVEHMDKTLGSRLKFELEKGKDHYSATEKALSYNWGDFGPTVEVQPDNFTATFDQSQYLSGGDYFIQTMADDGVRVDFDQNRVIDRWNYSSNSIIDRVLLTGVSAGNHTITTNYREGIKEALLYSNIVPFGDWVAYYYPNQTLDGSPIGSKVLEGIGTYDALSENNGYDSPLPNQVPVDGFSASYVTAKRISAGEYVVRTGADDGIQVLIDGQMVVDRFTNGGFREDSIKINIADHTNGSASEKDIHWIEVRYKEATQASRAEFVLQPYNDAKNISKNDGWFAEFFSNENLTGPSVIMGGKDPLVKLNDVDFEWNQEAPSPLLPADHFSAILKKKIEITEPGNYVFTIHADDGIRLYVDGNKKIDSWKYVSGNKRQITMDLSAGVHDIEIHYFDGILGAELKFELDKVSATSFIEVDLRKPSDITAQDIVDFFDRKNRSGSLLKQYAQDFINVQNKTGVNAQYLVAHAIWETGWGESTLTEYKRNFFGYGAYDSCPVTCAFYFPTGDDSISYVAYQVKKDYLTPGGRYYNGPDLVGMNVKYATDQNWKNGIADLMEQIKPFDAQYYDRVDASTYQPPAPPTYSRDIPNGEPYPTHIYIDFPAGITGVVNDNGVNYRTLPYVSSSTLIGQLNAGTRVEVTGINTDVRDDWYRIKVNGQEVWFSGDYLDIGNLIMVTDDGLRIRKGPSTNDDILTTVNSNTYLKRVLDNNGNPVENNDWYQIYLPNSNSTGWLSKDYVKVVK
ncbi:PA14 domain-containing protein [Bacillus spongiae]|uniref:PA14 domain-containing protein n=1 Tax=Bacillus spongiae TaxID=2683610 RepID=A0ABU8HGG0_9BACI